MSATPSSAIQRAEERRTIRKALGGIPEPAPSIKRSRRKKGDGREPGGFVALPWSVLDSRAYQALSHPARALLLEVARQYHGDDNGRMLLSDNHLRPRGWRSPDVITRAKRELIEAGLIHETVKGHRPNKASWYALTWYALDRNPAYDAGATGGFIRGAYRMENASLTTRDVVAKRSIATRDVVEKAQPTTPDVAIRALIHSSPTTPDVDPLDMPSSGAREEGGIFLTGGKLACLRCGRGRPRAEKSEARAHAGL